jgi:hypothetical protein
MVHTEQSVTLTLTCLWNQTYFWVFHIYWEPNLPSLIIGSPKNFKPVFKFHSKVKIYHKICDFFAIRTSYYRNIISTEKTCIKRHESWNFLEQLW